MSWLHEQTTEMLRRIHHAKAKNAFPYFRPFENIGSRVKVERGSYINFASNDYLGLSQDPKVIAASAAGVHRYGTGLGSARPQATTVRHVELEGRLARWTGYPACVVFTTGYQAVVGTLQGFLDDGTSVVVDRLCHASVFDGLLLAQGRCPELEVRTMKHNNVEHLRTLLSECTNTKRMVVVEGLYSVDGDLAPVAEIVDVARAHGAVVVVDDAHGLGAIGATGRGTLEVAGILGQADVLIGAFSKSFGTIGGFVCADQDLIDYMKMAARGFVFSASLPIACAEAALSALDRIENDASLLRKLESNAKAFRSGLTDLGFDLGGSTTHISPIFIRDETKAFALAAMLYQAAGIIMMPFVAPGVPPGTERLRCNVTATHTPDQMAYAIEALAILGRHLGVLPNTATTKTSFPRRLGLLAQHKAAALRQVGLPFLWHDLRATGELVRGVLPGGSREL